MTYFYSQRSTHGDKVTCFARVELGGSVLGESVRGECGGVIPVELTVEVNCDVTDPMALDSLSKHPLLGKYNVYISYALCLYI